MVTLTIRNLGLAEAIPIANGALRLSNVNVVLAMQGGVSRLVALAEYNPLTCAVKYSTTGYSGYQFNCPNEVVEAPDSSAWFTDPHYGFEQGFRPRPTMEN